MVEWYFHPLVIIQPIINSSAASGCCVQEGPHNHSTFMHVFCVLSLWVHNTTYSPPLKKKKASYTGALFKRQRIDGNLWQWRAGHSWVSISPLSLWTPGSTAAQHNAPLSPPAFTPVPRGEMDKRERGRKKWEVEGGRGGGGTYLSRCLTLYLYPLRLRRGHNLLVICFGNGIHINHCLKHSVAILSWNTLLGYLKKKKIEKMNKHLLNR